MNRIERLYGENIYAGVLGKIIGVYLGRPVEGWAYQKIIDTFGDLPYYKHQECNEPLIVADDDISGTFAFFRALEDNGYKRDLSAEEIGHTWLNYIIEDKTILWWGGLGRSTEHTAYLNLKRGIPAPKSGSIDCNGSTLAQQIGAQIFIDAFALACPEDPELAVRLVRNAASVSHDGIAVDAACYLAAMESMAFREKSIDKLLDSGLKFVSNYQLLALINDVRNICAKESNWREVRNILDDKYGYHRYPGCCHIVPNHAWVLASLVLGGDDFQKSIQIAASAGWDTDCNAGNIGCLNGVRLGLKGINSGADFRTPVADQLYVVCSDGGSVISDAVQEAQAIIRAASALAGEAIPEKTNRFTFAFAGSVQGFAPCPYSTAPYSNVRVGNAACPDGGRGLALKCFGIGPGLQARVSAPTFLENHKIAHNFSTVASPTLYETQTLRAAVDYREDTPIRLSPYILYYDRDDKVQTVNGPVYTLEKGTHDIQWSIPSVNGMPVFRIGFAVESETRFDGSVLLKSVDWAGAPKKYQLKGMIMTSIWNTQPSWLRSWTSSAKQFQADFKYTLCISHPDENGVATIGTSDWRDYAVTSVLEFSLHKAGGLVLRSRGHRCYYASILTDYRKVQIIMRKNDQIKVLAETDFVYEEDSRYQMQFAAKGSSLSVRVNGQLILTAEDNTYGNGSAGLVIDCGTMCVDGFSVEAEEG